MEAACPSTPAFPLEDYSRRAARAWWADGLWDLAVAGFCFLTAVWIYPLVRTQDFPSWTWPWPFVTQEHINPLMKVILLWMAGLLLLWTVYFILARILIDRLKRRFIAPRIGDVRYKFFLPMKRSEGLIFWLFYVLGSVILGLLFRMIKGGPHLYSVYGIVSFGVILFLLGRIYHLQRYLWVSIIGSAVCILAELITTTAVYMNGPASFMDVSPLYGNPTLIFLIWAVILLINGLVSLGRTLRMPDAEA